MAGVLDITCLKVSRRVVACSAPVYIQLESSVPIYAKDIDHPVNNRSQSFPNMVDKICQ